jgi:iron complex transport system substrate-binding protein
MFRMKFQRVILCSAGAALVVIQLLLLAACRRGEPAPGPGEARRVITLTPSLTEIVFALGAGPLVVGVSDYCDYPREATTRPRIGTFLQPNLERILALQPDLVFVDGVQKDVAAALAQAGVGAVPVSMNSLSEVRQAIVQVGQALGRPAAAERLLARLDAELAEVEKIWRATAATRTRPRVFFSVDREVGGLRGLVAAGPGTYLDELLRHAGGHNIFSDLPLRYAKVPVEEVTARQPDVILDAVHISDPNTSERVLADWQALREVPAVRTGRVFLLSQRAFVTPGPRLGQALRELTAMLQPR